MDAVSWVGIGAIALLVGAMAVRAVMSRRQPPSEGADAERAEVDRLNREHRRVREREGSGPDVGNAGMG